MTLPDLEITSEKPISILKGRGSRTVARSSYLELPKKEVVK